jgi:hypothetical protein
MEPSGIFQPLSANIRQRPIRWLAGLDMAELDAVLAFKNMNLAKIGAMNVKISALFLLHS